MTYRIERFFIRGLNVGVRREPRGTWRGSLNLLSNLSHSLENSVMETKGDSVEGQWSAALTE